MLHTEQTQHQNRIAQTLTLVCLVGGILLFAVSMYTPAFPAALQLLGVTMLVAGIALVGFCQTKYVYRIEPDSRGVEGYDFVVLQIKSRRESVVCRLGLADVRAIEHQTSENRDAIKKTYAEQGRTVHSYCVDILPERSQYVTFDDGGETVVIRLQASAQLIEILEQNMPKE
jgi:CHASE2 domain-containing sensor protein